MTIKLASIPKQFFAIASLCVFAMVATPASASEKGANMYTETEQSNKALVQRTFNGWAVGFGSPFDLLADDTQWTITGKTVASRTYPNKAAFINEVIRPFNARMSTPLKPVIREIYADGDMVIVFFDATGTAADGKPYVNTYTWFMEMKDQKAVRVVAFFDPIEFNDLWKRVKPVPQK